MKQQNHFFLIVFFLLYMWAGGAMAQDFKKEYILVHDAYNKLDNFYCELKINVFEDEKTTVPMQKMTATIKKRTTDYWYTMGDITMLLKDDFILYVNTDAKQMVYTIRDKKRELPVPNQDAVSMMDSVLKNSDSVVYKGVQDQCKKYIIYSQKQTIARSEMWINESSHLITKIVYHYNAQKGMASSKVEINYVKINMNPVFTDADFSEKQYAILSKKTIKPIGKYIGYETSVIDQHDIK
jgi:hypothetical protein